MKLSVVMPAYNEESLIESAIDEVGERVFSVVPRAELIVVNDGSSDGTGRILDRISKEDPRVLVYATSRVGHGPALLKALSHARGEFILLLDSDRQIPLDVFAAAWERAQGLDAVLGTRSSRDDPWVRLFITTVLRSWIRLRFRCRLQDANCAFKIVRRDLWALMEPHIPRHSLIPSIYIAILLKRSRRGVVEYPVPYRQRPGGETRLHLKHLIVFCSRAFFQLEAFRRTLGGIPTI